MEEDSEEIFNQVVAGSKELGLEIKTSRHGKCEFQSDSASQESLTKATSNIEVFTYEVDEAGEMMLLEQNSIPVLSDEVPPQEVSVSREISCAHSSLQHDQELTIYSLPNQIQPYTSPQPNSSTNTELCSRAESDSPTIFDTIYNQELEMFDVVPISSPSTSCIELTRTNTNYDPDNTSCSSDDDNTSEIRQEETRKSKKRKGLAEPEFWKAKMNKKLRESGKDYIGWKRNENSCNKNNVSRPARKLKEPCKSECCKSSKERHCNEFSEECRQRIFDLFWGLSWDQKRIFVVNTTDKSKTSKPAGENSRRSASLQYYLKKDDVKFRVCKQMYLNTLNIGEWSVRKWVNESESGMFPEPTDEQKEKKKRQEHKKLTREFLVEFIENLPKLPSHYCRKDTSKVYLEPNPGGMLEIFKTYSKASLDKELTPLSRTMFDKIIREKNIGFQQPKKDLCDTCLRYLTKQISEEVYKEHQTRKKCARVEKERDLNESKEGKCVVLEQDVQAVKVCPYIKASSAYYRRKLINHNFTIYEYPSKKVIICYWFSEVDGDTQASVFVSCIIDYLNDIISHAEDGFSKPIVIWSDGCTYQNRNAILANALSNFAALNGVVLYHKYLEPGHTQMEVDSVHAAIERRIQAHDAIYVPSQYADITIRSRKDPQPYEVKNVKYDFFKKYDDPKVIRYESIRPGKKKGDPVVTDLKAVMYKPDGKIYYKTSFEEENYTELPSRPKNIVFPVRTYANLFEEKVKLTSSKYTDLQALKSVIPEDYHSFYDNLPHN